MANKLTNYFKPKSRADNEKNKSLILTIINEVKQTDSDSSDSNDMIWSNISSKIGNNKIEYDDDVICIDDDDMISSAQDTSKHVSRYTQEDVSTLGLDDDGRDIIFLSSDDERENESDDDDEDLIIYMEKNKSLLLEESNVKTEKVDSHDLNSKKTIGNWESFSKIKNEKIDLNLNSKLNDIFRECSDDDNDDELIEFLEKNKSLINIKSDSKIIDKKTIEIKIEKGENSRYFPPSTKPARPDHQIFDFECILDDEEEEEEEEGSPILQKSSKERKRIRSESSSSAEEEKVVAGKSNNREIISDKEKYEKFLEKTKSNYSTPRTILINSPKRIKISSVESVKPSCSKTINLPPPSSSPGPLSPVCQDPDVTSTMKQPTQPTLSLNSVKKQLLAISKDVSRHSKTPHSTTAFTAPKNLSKIGEKLKKDKSYEARALANSSIAKAKKPANNDHSCGSISLTQGIKVAKQENRARTILMDKTKAQRASILIPIQQKSTETKTKTQQKTTNSEKEPENKKPIFEKPTTPISGFKKPNKHVSTDEVKTKPAETKARQNILLKNGINDDMKPKPLVDPQRKKTNKSTNDTQAYDTDKFFLRILKWNFNWIEEQAEKKGTPPLLEGDVLIPLIDRYVKYDDYYKTMFPLLLLETWEEISKSWLDVKSTSNRKTMGIVWLKTIGKYQSSNEMVELVCQTIVDSNDVRAPIEEDLLKIELEVCAGESKEEKKKIYEMKNYFGIIKRLNKLKAEDSRNMPQMKTKLEDFLKIYQNKKDKLRNVLLYEFNILIRARKYNAKIGTELQIQKVVGLSSSIRRVKALVRLKDSFYISSLLNPQSHDSIFSFKTDFSRQLSLNDTKKEFNESQKFVITEASSILEYSAREPKFYFIQGPPGTGKSHTIIGIIRTMFKNRKKPILTKDENKLKILVCSPSNGGCDELARRLKHEIEKNLIEIDDKEFGLVRIGRAEGIHEDCESILIDNLVKKKTISNEQFQKSDSLSKHYEGIKSKEKSFKEQIEAAKNSSNLTQMREIEDQLNDLLKKKKDLESRLNNLKSGDDRKRDNFRRKEEILKDASIIITTLNWSGNQILNCLCGEKNENKSLINAIIIDEASQCLEVDCLIPLRFGCNKFILVGDPEQLPATVLSKKAQEVSFNQSLFERVYQCFKFENVNPIKMLSIQYRMHPDICTFPSRQFYKSKLLTDQVAGLERKKFEFKPYLMFNLTYSQEVDSENNGGLFNSDEANFALSLCLFICKNEDHKSIGIITPYQKQVQHLKELFRKNRLNKIEIGTVDSFQGREKDIILLSCVRANSSTGTIGFLSNRQRLNVSLTRAKYGLFIICNKKSLKINDDWNSCIRDAEDRNLIVDVVNKENENRINFSDYLKKTANL